MLLMREKFKPQVFLVVLRQGITVAVIEAHIPLLRRLLEQTDLTLRQLLLYVTVKMEQ